MGAEDEQARLAQTSFLLTGSGRSGSILDVHGGAPAMRIAKVLLEDAAWPMVRVRAQNILDPAEWYRTATVRYHPTERRRLLVLFVDGSEQWSVLRNVNGPVTAAEATQAAVRFVAGLPLPHWQRLEPIETREVDLISARPERTRMVDCDCGGLRLRAPWLGMSFCWREKIDPKRTYQTHWVGKPMTRREQIIWIIERLTFGLI